MKRIPILLVVILGIAAAATGQETPPSVGELAYRLTSPIYLGGGAHLTRLGTPQGVAVNPAMAAGFQRTILDVNYSNLQGLGDGASGTGHAANLGMSVPTRVGVVTGTLGFVDTSAYAGTPMDLGVFGRMNLAFSKEIYSDVWFGTSLSADLGELDGQLDGGAALNFGFLHFPDTFGGLRNFRWGGSLLGLGYRYGSTGRGYFSAIPSNITPAMGIAFDVVDTTKFTWTFRTDVRAPSVSDLWAGVGSDLAFGDTARISVSSSLDIRDAFDGSWQTIIPSAALGIHFTLGGGRSEDDTLQTTEMDVQVAAAPLYDGIWAFSGGVTLPFGVRDDDPPDLEVTYDPSPQYISPNYDGVQDELTFPYAVRDERYIVGYTWRIEDADGSVVRTFVNKDERPENESVKNLWTRLVSPKEGTPLPEAFRWDGVTESGSVADDGDYVVYLEFRDDNDNRAEAGPFPVVVDTVAPDLSLEVPEGLDLIFSPDGDGLKDLFRVEQSGSVEHLWEGRFDNSEDDTVRGWAWADAAPAAFDWDGQSDGGEIVPDGVYRYVVAATDRAGNASEDRIDGIIIDTLQPEIGLSIDRSVFSPGTASPVATVDITPLISVKTGIVDWSVDVIDEGDGVRRSWSRRESPAIPDTLSFDGRDAMGRILAEGPYRARLTVEYGNGFRSAVESPRFVVDVTPPRADVAVDYSLFSPQSGSRRDRVTLSQSTSTEENWSGNLRSSDGSIVKSWTWIRNADASVVWDGRDNEGRLVPDGIYTYVLQSTDRAGNAAESAPVRITVDTSAVEASLTASLDVFGPTGNGVNDTVGFFLDARTDSPVSGWTMVVQDADGREARRWDGEGSPTDRIEWNGRDAEGRPAADGDYRAELTVRYEKGDVAVASSGAVTLDTVPPTINVRIDEGLFSPDGDGSKDVLRIVQTSSREDSFAAVVYDSEERPVRNWLWKDSLETVEWDGTDDSGNPLPDGDYRYEAYGTDRAGNRTSRSVRGLRIDTAPTPVYLTAALGYIKAGEIDPERVQSFTAVVPNDAGVESWSFGIEGEDGRPVFSDSGTGAVPSEFRWNGVDRADRPVEGVFKGTLTVVYAKGARPRAESRPFVSDGSPPEVSVALEPQPFSPDGDNVDDEVVIGLAVEDRSRIGSWSLEIADPRGRDFISFSGRGRPSERIIWDGRSGRGELVASAEDYPYVLTVTDVLGHTATRRGLIAVDVLVIREGDRLKIQINNITFQPSSPQLTLEGEEGEKNRRVLDRLAEIMTKYGSYRIIVEGHAVSLNWANPAAAAREQRDILVPLSRARAQTVVDELIARGVAPNRLSAEGIGGDEPIVPHGDLEERWRNRRVEFYLEK